MPPPALPDPAIVSTLLEDLLDPEGRGLDPGFLAGATSDMLARVRIMPRYMGTGIVALTLLFGLGGYTRMPKAKRVRRIERWRRSPVSPLRDFVEFYEKMGTFVYYSRMEHAS